MAKYNKKIIETICEMIRSDSYTISEICNNAGIARVTYYDWLAKYPEFAEAVSEAEKDFKELLLTEAKKSLIKLVKGYTVQEKKTVTADTGKKDDDGKPIVKIKEHTVIDKHIQPSITATIFTLTNGDPASWKNRHNQELSGEVSVKSELEHMSDDELMKIINGDGE